MTTDLFADTPASPSAPLSHDELEIARAMAILWSYRPRAVLHNALRLLNCKRGDMHRPAHFAADSL